ncbi:DUF115 domain-containing protein, partial [Campylobacter sp. RKI_CA19_01121]|uniref:motility associated factor glycosyltransferase family protein n=1 Tax=Campylobacter sp. RKI_CA19_01121 TaxID=2911626 RepID=UPI0021E96244
FDMDNIINFLMGELYLRNYLYESKILLLNSYYNKYSEKRIELENQLNDKINYVFIAQGITGIESFKKNLKQSIQNTARMLGKPLFKDLIKQREGKNSNAVIVASGPSLIKQLPLLKEFQDKTTIISADGSYPILAKYNIKPDYVMCLETNELSSEFFNNNFEELDKNITFIITASTNPKTIDYLDKNQKKYLLVLKPSATYTHKYLIDNFGSLGGLNVASMGFEFAVKLKHKNIILIGQDLAYDENGNSHPMEFLYNSTLDTYRYEHIKTLAYGGKGEVWTHGAWKTYIQSYELCIKDALKNNITTYNATEGGARIEGTIEKPFKELCENLLKEDKTTFPHLPVLSKEEQLLLARLSYEHFIKLINFGKSKIYQCQKLLKPILKVIEQTRYHINLNTINFVKILKTNDELHRVKEFIEDENMSIFTDSLVIALTTTELELAKISTMSAHTQEDKKIRMIIWLIKHEEWLKIVIETLETQIKIIENSIQNLKKFIEDNS